MAAECPHCSEQVMPYRRFAGHLRRTAICDSCGLKVAIRGYYLSAISAVLVVVALIVFSIRSANEPKLIILLALLVVGFAIDYSMWRWLGFETAGPSSSAESASGHAS